EKWVAQAADATVAAARRDDQVGASSRTSSASAKDASNTSGPVGEPPTDARQTPVLPEFAGFGLKVDPLTAKQREILAIPPDQRTQEQVRELFNVFRCQDAGFSEANQEIDNVLTNWPYAATTLALQQRAVPREAYIFNRDDRQQPGET